jgi:uncharacterized iron-regulated membrane protein
VKIKSLWLRQIHKWIGLVIGLQFVMWALSGTAMALLDMEEVAGGAAAQHVRQPLQSGPAAWPRIRQALAGEAVIGVRTASLPQGPVYQVTTSDGVRLFAASDGRPVTVSSEAAAGVASAAHPGGARVKSVSALDELSFAVRDFELPIWKVDFDDSKNSSYYVSGSTGQLLARRNDTWRWWDFFWMLHIMDYSERSSFNHPLIITVGFAMAWLAVTGFWLLFRTMWRHDFSRARSFLGRLRKKTANTSPTISS